MMVYSKQTTETKQTIKSRNSKMFVGFIHGYFEDSNTLKFFIFSFVLLFIKENISSSKIGQRRPHWFLCVLLSQVELSVYHLEYSHIVFAAQNMKKRHFIKKSFPLLIRFWSEIAYKCFPASVLIQISHLVVIIKI